MRTPPRGRKESTARRLNIQGRKGRRERIRSSKRNGAEVRTTGASGDEADPAVVTGNWGLPRYETSSLINLSSKIIQ